MTGAPKEYFGTTLKRSVPGEVLVMTDEPVYLPHPDGVAARATEMIQDNRWLIPLVVVGAVAAVVVVRRRS
jgi:hypothetical protein